MGRRGPKPVDAKRLEAEAAQWARFFYTLRDGQPGYAEHTEPGKPGNIIEFLLTATGEVQKQLVKTGGARESLDSLQVAKEKLHKVSDWVASRSGGDEMDRAKQLSEPVMLIPVSEAARTLPPKMQFLGWTFYSPVMPKPGVWKQLKKAHTSRQVKRAAQEIGDLQNIFTSSSAWSRDPAGALSHYAKGIHVAKKLPHYPRTDRPRSDDKRLQFLAKVMAGLTLGLAPITAVKRLSGWKWPKDWAERSLKEFVEWKRTTGE
jgi:hypothetical protein